MKKTKMRIIRWVSPLLMVLSLLLSRGQVNAAMIAGFSGDRTIVSLTSDWTADVHYEVWGPGIDAAAPFALPAGDYGYFYQIHNRPTSLTALHTFTLSNPAPIAIFGTTPGTGGGFFAGAQVSPNGVLNPSSVEWSTVPGFQPGDYSRVLFIITPWAPDWGVASLQNGGPAVFFLLPYAGIAPGATPVSVPEPASMLLLVSGLLGLVLNKKREKTA